MLQRIRPNTAKEVIKAATSFDSGSTKNILNFSGYNPKRPIDSSSLDKFTRVKHTGKSW